MYINIHIYTYIYVHMQQIPSFVEPHGGFREPILLQCVACCSVLQCVAEYCGVLQYAHFILDHTGVYSATTASSTPHYDHSILVPKVIMVLNYHEASVFSY